MTKSNHIDEFKNVDELILFAAKEYIRITDISPSDFVEELYDLAGQAVSHYGDDIKSTADKFILATS